VTSNPGGWNVELFNRRFLLCAGESSSVFPALEVTMPWRRRARRNVARCQRYRRRGALAKAAPAIPAETSVAKVPNTPDGQFALWPGQDPNDHRLGLYEFEIEATPLDQALWAAELPTRQTPFLTIELSTVNQKKQDPVSEASPRRSIAEGDHQCHS
jgi:hypothetical protein